jgi:hypothetical protein
VSSPTPAPETDGRSSVVRTQSGTAGVGAVDPSGGAAEVPVFAGDGEAGPLTTVDVAAGSGAPRPLWPPLWPPAGAS